MTIYIKDIVKDGNRISKDEFNSICTEADWVLEDVEKELTARGYKMRMKMFTLEMLVGLNNPSRYKEQHG